MLQRRIRRTMKDVKPVLALPEGFQFVGFEKREDMLTVTILSTQVFPCCPSCRSAARRVHSCYTRHVADLPCAGQSIRLLIQVRKYFCEEALAGAGIGCAIRRRSRVVGGTALPIWVASREPASPLVVKPISSSKRHKRLVIRDQGSMKSGRRSEKIRCGQLAVSQKNLRISSESTTRRPPLGRSAAVRR